MNTQPVNNITFLFTDIEGNTGLWKNFPEQMSAVLVRHDEIIDDIVVKYDGEMVRPRGEGDSRFVVFRGSQNAANAVLAAAEIQKALYDELWQIPVPLRVRIALHTGDADKIDSDYYGIDVNHCAGIRSLTHGGQTLLSATTAALVRTGLSATIQLRDLQRHYLKGDAEPEHLFQLVIPGIPNEFLPLKRQSPPKSVQKRQSAEERKRQALVENVYRDWIDGVLNRSLQQSAMLNLRMELVPNAISPLPPHKDDRFFSGQSQTDLTLAKIPELYKRFNGQLLILGAPGSGKSTVLLILLDALLREAEWNVAAPMPVLFNLSSWASKRSSLEVWLIEELERQFRVPKAIGQIWVQKQQIIPLLDGLDEVIFPSRDVCVAAINAYQQKHSREALVVCCRSSEYAGLQTQLTLRGVTEIQPLTMEEVTAYVSSHSGRLSDLASRLQQDAALRELITSPLMTSFLPVIQDDLPMVGADMSSEVYRTILLKSYVEKTLTNTHKARPHSEDSPFGDQLVGSYSLEQAYHKLKWLAKWLHERNENIFYIEHLQPDVLSHRFRSWYMRILALILSLIVGISVGFGVNRIDQGIVWMTAAWLILTILGNSKVNSQTILPWTRPFCYHNSLLLASVWGISESVQLLHSAPQPLEEALIAIFGRTVLIGIPAFVAAFIFSLIAPYIHRFLCHIYEPIALSATVALWSAVSASGGLTSFYYLSLGNFTDLSQRVLSVSTSTLICSSLFITISQEIQPIERLRWSWRTILLVSLLIIATFLWNQQETAILSAFILGSSGMAGITKIEARRFPNQGIWQSARYAVIGGGIGILIWICLWLVTKQYIGSVQIGIRMLPAMCILLALRSGLIPCFQHLLIRLILWWNGTFDWKGINFLEDMVGRSLLYRTGGGYLFSHRLFLEYFLSLLLK